MLIKTHLAITAFAVLAFISSAEHKLVFSLVAMASAFIPDIDSRFSVIGRPKIARILQFFTKHRGITHSFTFLLMASVPLALFFPVIALPFFLGYGLHLFADSLTKDGIIPFYPYRKKSSWIIRTGGRTEAALFVFFIIGSLFLIVGKIGGLF